MFKKWFGFGRSEAEKVTDAPEPAEAEVQAEEALEEAPADAPEAVGFNEAEAEEQLEAALEEIVEEEELPLEEPVQQESIFKKLFSGLDKTRKSIVDRIDVALNNYGEIDEALFEEIEEILITADIGMETTMKLVADLRQELIARKAKEPEEVHRALAAVMERMLTEGGDQELEQRSPAIYLVIGVNGAGKTTSIGKLSWQLRQEGKRVLLAAADTFRAAAIDQLKVWADRTGVPVISHQEGSDPAAVVFDAIQAAKSRNADVLICDTAGRLHNKKNLMNELSKIFRIVEREWPEAHREVLLVLDATTGQNAVQQARLFKEAADISGIILTKLDGTAKGGVVLAIKSELGIPVKLIGVGEGMRDLQRFNAKSFASALMNLEG